MSGLPPTLLPVTLMVNLPVGRRGADEAESLSAFQLFILLCFCF
jgi:hypothetical protein